MCKAWVKTIYSKNEEAYYTREFIMAIANVKMSAEEPKSKKFL